VLLLTQLTIPLVTLSQTGRFDFGILCNIVSFTACIGLCPLLFLEHTRSIRPSDLAVVYLLFSFVCEAAELGITLHEDGVIPASLPAMANLCVKFILLLVESRGKEIILRGPRGQWPPEQLAGVLSRTFFWWINAILAKGSRNILTEDNLPPIDHQLSSRLLRQQALLAWDQRGKHLI
jgi:ATP-binding cassette, subfamily C (CFTR/MRP), member 1